MLLIQVKDLPYFAMIVIGVVLPEVYLRFRWKFYALATIRMVTLLGTCILATLLNHLAYPTIDTSTIFVRAFIYIGICRMIILSSHEVSERGQK